VSIPAGDSEPSFWRPDSDRPQPRRHQAVDRLPTWRVILHDDEVFDTDAVADVIADLLPLTINAATRRALEAQKRGVSVLLRTHRELAELYYLQLSKQNLIVSIEPE